ncbi:HK97 gp10 family phage protein [Lachnospiraceae bacterium OttesenSCG-928-J05]|nr:HK97 gp10 family phage protein [Lachnospiraceae bacterium OttesenSCG-928-J05]
MSINVDQLASEIAKGLTEYSDEVTEIIKEGVEKISKEAAQELKASSPKKTGSYAKGWTTKTAFENKRSKRKSVYNKTDYQLTHLLEKGHAKRNGGRTAPIVHIAKVEKKMIRDFENYVSKELEG